MKTIDFEGRHIEFRDYHPICKKRVDSFLTKEPDTIEWLKTLRSTDVLWDIGANIGIYALPAAVKVGEVWAFEPHPFNYVELLANCRENCGLNVRPVHAAVGGQDAIEKLRVPDFSPGAAMTSISGIGYRGKAIPESVEWVMVPSYTGASLIGHGISRPTVLKIDVDGVEPDIVWGMTDIMANVREVLCEVDMKRKDHQRMVSKMLELGFAFDSERADRARRREGPNEGVGNILFYRRTDNA